MITVNVTNVIQDILSRITTVYRIAEMNTMLLMEIASVQIFSSLFTHMNLECGNNCQNCINANICQTCNSGFGLQNGQCAACPSNTYLSGQDCLSMK